MKPEPHDVVVVGSGLLGLLVAEQLTSKGRRVEVLVSPGPDPRSDSQRNHSWLQSGLLYPGNIHARKMYYDGLEMLDHFGFSAPIKRGIFRFSCQEEVDAFLGHAEKIRLRGQVKDIPDVEARYRLGVFFQPGHFHFEVPDAPFPEAELMEAARARASRLGATFHQCRVDLKRDESSTNGYVVVAGHRRLVPRTTIVCAGAGTPKILRDLDLPHPLVVNQSVLLVIEGATGVRVPLLADRTTGFTLVTWDARESPPRGRLVVGAAERRLVSTEGEDIDRRTQSDEEDFLLRLIPSSLNIEKRMYRFTPGQKTDVLVEGRSTVAPWVHAPTQFPGLILGTPGKATLAFAVAKQILARIEAEIREVSGLHSARHPDEPLPGAPWRDPIRAHSDACYDPPKERETDENS